MSVGRMRHRIELQSSTTTRDSTYGQAVEAWTTQATVWADVKQESGGESTVGNQRQGSISYTAITRYRSDITAGWRFVWGDAIVNITAAIDMDGHRHWTVITGTQQTTGALAG